MANEELRKAEAPNGHDEEQASHRLVLRNTRLADYQGLREIMELVYGNLGGAWSKQQVASQIARFPEGQICIEDNGKVVAAAISLIVDYSRYGDNPTYRAITGDGRSEARRGGKECVSTCRTGWSPDNSKKNKIQTNKQSNCTNIHT